VAVVAVAVVTYCVLIALYGARGLNEGFETTATPDDAVGVVIDLGDLDATTNRQQADVTITPGVDLLSADGISPATDIDLIVVPTAGQQQLHFPAGEVPATVPVQLLVDGEIEKWPFDTYENLLIVQAQRVVGGVTTAVPFTTTIEGHVKGWKTVVEPTTEEAAASSEVQVFTFNAKRAGGTLAFGLVMVAILVALPVLALFATSEVFRGRRRVEPSFASWVAAMLFAVVPLRNFLPGSPPPGSWIDVTVVLWVLVGLVVSLVLYVAAWWRHGRPHER
jgi:hypothetical protein